MANQSYPESVMFPGLSESSVESVIVPGLSESNQADLLDPEQTDTKPKLSVHQIVSILRHLSLALYLFGLFSNISILLVFFKDGFSSSTNIALFSLAVADLTVCVLYSTALISKLLYYICSPCYAVYREFANIERVEYLATAIATYITAILCWERLCCIAYPMKVKRIFTPKLTICMILGYALLQALGLVIVVASNEYISSVYSDPGSYNGVFGRLGTCARRKLDITMKVKWYTIVFVKAGPNFIMYSLLLLGSILFIIVFKRGIQARKSLTAKKNHSDSVKERRLMQSILVMCIIYIITSGPRTVNRVLQLIFNLVESDFEDIYYSVARQQYFIVLQYMLQSINHSFNIFVYLSMNSKFRRLFCQMFCLKRCNDANQLK